MNQELDARLLKALAPLVRRYGVSNVVTAAIDISQARMAAVITSSPTERNDQLARAILTRRNQTHV